MLYVIKRAEDKRPGRPMWLCQCDCGAIVTVSSTNLLKANGTKSCGCLRRKPTVEAYDLTDQKFGLLTARRRDTNSKSGRVRWICECKCGNTVSVLADSLRSGATQSCGCLKSRLHHDLTGKTFGYLKVIAPIKNPRFASNETRWQCHCENCGRTVEVYSYPLRHSDPYGHCKCTRFNKPDTA